MPERTAARADKATAHQAAARETQRLTPERAPAGGWNELLGLQRMAGNRAVSGLVEQPEEPQVRPIFAGAPVLQRAPQMGFVRGRTEGTQTAGTPVSSGPNAGESKIGTIRRIPLSGLTLGNKEAWMKNRYGGRSLTSESAAGSAVVLIPDSFDASKPADVLLHLHGKNEGYRASGGQVMDVAVEKIEAQMQASKRNQLIGILPQGTSQAAFGPDKGFDADAYMNEVLNALVTLKIWSSKPNIGRVILSGHSGAGEAINEKMLSAQPGTSAPSKMKELVLFDAVNGPREVAGLIKWIQTSLDHDLHELTKKGVTTKDQADYLASSTVFRGYHTGPDNATPNDSINTGYANRYAVVQKAINDWFSTNAAALGGSGSTLYTGLYNHYLIKSVQHYDHDAILGKDNKLLEAINALPAPTTTAATGQPQVSPQRASPSPPGPSVAPPSVDAGLLSAGEPLDAGARRALEERLGHDFREVRVHRGVQAEDSAEAIAARAYTVGRDIVFGAGEYQPHTEAGRQLLAHELSHVIQQSGSRRHLPGESLQVTPAHDPSELQAEHVATRASARSLYHLGYAAVQRQPLAARPLDTAHPENAPTYQQWLATFSNLPTFTAKDTRPDKPDSPLGFDVIGEKAASHDPGAAAGEQAPPPAGEQIADHFIDHPTDDWVKKNLPANLREDAYRLPADCADIAVILRHVWLSAHHRTETYNGWVVGDQAGGPAKERALGLIRSVYSGNVKQMVAPYSDSDGNPIRDWATLQNLLHPGDVLVWEHHSHGLGTERTGGHTQTITNVARDDSGAVTSITVVQGNQPIGPTEAAEIRDYIKEQNKGKKVKERVPSESELRSAPGRRIEREQLAAGSLRDLTPPQKSKKGPAPKPVWTWSDGHTTLVVAGPPRAAPRPAMQTIGGERKRRLSDWVPAFKRAPLDALEGTLESALQEMRALIEGGKPVADDEARALGQAAGERLWTLARGTTDPGSRSFSPLRHMEMIEEMRAIIRALGAGEASPAAARKAAQDRVRQVFALVEQSFHLAARGGASIDFTRKVPAGTEIVKVLLTGFDPFNTENSTRPARTGEWNPSGAAVLALDGQTVRVDKHKVAAVEGVVLPVNFDEFRSGLVERIVGPFADKVDAVITVSEDPSLAPEDPVRFERYAVGVHRLNNGRLEAVPAAPGAAGGPMIIESGAPLTDIAKEVAKPAKGKEPGTPEPAIGTDLVLCFASAGEADTALAALGQPKAGSDTVTISDPQAIQRIIATMSQGKGPADIRFRPGSRDFNATVVRGPGGSFLSNEVSYRVQRLLKVQPPGSRPTSFHVHTQRGTTEEGGVIPEGKDKDTLKERRKALGVASRIRGNLITTLQRTIRAVAERV